MSYFLKILNPRFQTLWTQAIYYKSTTNKNKNKKKNTHWVVYISFVTDRHMYQVQDHNSNPRWDYRLVYGQDEALDKHSMNDSPKGYGNFLLVVHYRNLLEYKKINTLGRFSQLKICPLPYKWINSRINLVICKITTKEKLFESFSKKLIDFKLILQRKVQINFPERSFDSNLNQENLINPKLTL